ncbi:RagB/SusD family nutrient uptake outer membrane protein [Solitalea lacus]|uniref:RagB/SusD family nutrient uptake outer membrane protein n=1 Tax=Solitalea lacus TaxID=2911172 RepID=UPI001ED9E315|nr:RagB/SusD family nutrient uptake outer membrane protein [Solitalea lacus]UKJ06742.1 RagB/SusD family nutrient uptake outer membrane protein [Solitalea lacus]
MKISKYLILPAFSALALLACQKEGLLTNDTQTDIFDAAVWSDSIKTVQVLTSAYSGVGPENYMTRINTSNTLSEFSDESDERWSTTLSGWTFQQGAYTASSIPLPFTNHWSDTYKTIRKINLFIARVDESPLSAIGKKRMKAEARFLRAWFYHILTKTYGGVPILDRTWGVNEDLNLPRNTYEECVNFMIQDLDAAAADLPIRYVGQDYGRATKGACLALKARVLLFAASPLFNGGQLAANKDAIYGYKEGSPNRWVLARDAAKAVIDMGVYSLMQGTNNDNSTAEGFYKVFLTRNNPEMIFMRLSGSNRSYEASHLPKSRGGALHTSPNGNYVNAFPMANGKPITDPTSGYNPQNPYVGRDPRFYRSVIYNGATWKTTSGTFGPVYTYLNAPTDGLTIPFASVGTQSGYFNRKMMSEDVTGSTGGAEHYFPFLRYAEVLLNYAEALNENGQTAEAYAPMAEIRKRAGLNPFNLPTGLTQDQMRTYIRDERRIELAFEEHRFYDIRRWKILPDTYCKPLRMMVVTPKSGTITPLGTNYTYEERDFVKPPCPYNDNMYLLPIPQSQINISSNLKQNPGW